MTASIARYAASGNTINVDLTGEIDAFEARYRIGIALGVPLDRVRLLSHKAYTSHTPSPLSRSRSLGMRE